MAKVLGFTIQIQGTEQAVNTAEELRRAIAEVQKELKKAGDTESIERLEKKLIDLKARQGEVNAEIREQVKARQAELRASDSVEGAYARLSRQLNETRKRYKDLAAAGQEYTKEGIELRREITALDRKLKDIDASVGQFQRNVGSYTDSLAQFFPRLSAGLGTLRAGFQTTQTAATGLNKSLGLILLAVTVFQEVSAAITQATEAAKEYTDIARQLSNTQALTNEELEQGAGTIKAISVTYQQETRDIVNAANTLAKEFGVGLPEALELIEAGFRKGANAQGDFLDQLREYPAQFAAAGGSAAEFLDILIKAQQEGIYSDKGIDAVKEFGLRIREQTTATRAALENAFGRKFTDELFQGINNGSVTTVDALKRVGKGLQDTSLTAEQTQRVIADTFGGPGEDAGLRFLQLLGDIDTQLGDVTKSTNDYQSQQERLFQANERLSQAQAELALQLTNTGTEFALLKTNAQAFLTEAAAKVLEFFDKIPIVAKAAGAAIRGFFRGGLGRAIQDANQVIIDESIRTAEENAAAQAAAAAKAQAEAEQKAQEEAKRKAEAAARARGRAVGEKFIEGSVAAIQQKKSDLEKAIARAVAGSDAQAALIRELEKVEAQLEKAVEDQNRVRLEASRRADLERIGQIQQIGTLILNAQVTQEKRATDAVLAEVKKRNEQRAELEKQNARELAEFQQAQTQQIFEDSISVFFSSLDAFTQAANDRRNQLFAEQIGQTEARIADLESSAEESTGIRKRTLEKAIEQEKKLLAQQTANAEAEQKKQAKQEKKIALIQSIIQGALAVQRALATPPGPPFTIPSAIAAGVFAAVQTAAIAAQPLATGGIVGISGRKVNDWQNIPTRRNGDNVLATVKRGEVVLNQRQQAALGGARTFKKIGVPGFATGGPIGAPISAPRIPAVADSMAAIQAIDRKTDAINARLDRLRAFVVTEDIARDIQDGENIQIKASLS